MKIISSQECQEWLKTNFGRDFTSVESEYVYSVVYALPADTGVKTAFAREACHSIDTVQSGLFWITSWGIFPSSQNMLLFDGYRKSLGEIRPIHAAPGHVFEEMDLPHLECLLDLALYFYWDATLFDGAGTIAVKTSHDEYISIHTKDLERLNQFQSDIEKLEIKLLRTSSP